MDALTKNMLGLSVGLQATSLALSNVPRRRRRRKGLARQGVDNLIGIGLIGAQSKMIAGY